MEQVFELENGPRLLIKLPGNQAEKTKKTCFRGKKVRVTGNFSRWNDFGEMLADGSFIERLLEVLRDVIAGGIALLDSGFDVAEPIFVTCDGQVGWSPKPAEVVGLNVRVRKNEGIVEVLINKLYPCMEP